MSRLHKYRALIGGQMVYFSPLTLTEGSQELAAGHAEQTDKFWIDDYFGEEPAELMQWTGKTSGQGVDIYEKDILLIEEHNFSPMCFVVEWSETNSAWWLVSVERDHVYDSPKKWFSFADLNGFAEDATVLGNSIESPELLDRPFSTGG